MNDKYIFKSDRLGFRNWTTEDLTEFTNINANPEVMEFFPKPLTQTETAEFIDRLQNHYVKNGYNYFATEIIETGELIGFIGLAYQEYKTEFMSLRLEDLILNVAQEKEKLFLKD